MRFVKAFRMLEYFLLYMFIIIVLVGLGGTAYFGYKTYMTISADIDLIAIAKVSAGATVSLLMILIGTSIVFKTGHHISEINLALVEKGDEY